MALNDRKITDAEIAAHGVQSQPNKLTGSAQQNKQAFDKLIDEVVQEKFNALIDDLVNGTAAGEIGASVEGLEATTLNALLAEIKAIADRATHGTITPGSIATGDLADGAVTHAKLGSDILPEHVGIKYGTEMPTTATLGEGEIYLKLESE
jgi:hypothetical protein